MAGMSRATVAQLTRDALPHYGAVAFGATRPRGQSRVPDNFVPARRRDQLGATRDDHSRGRALNAPSGDGSGVR